MPITKKQLKDKEWRLSNLYKIISKSGEQITFRKNEAQADFDKNKHTRNLILKARQLGFTTFEAIDALDDTIWNRHFKALMLSYDKDSALEIFDDKIVLAWENLKSSIKSLLKIDADRANKLKFDFGDKTYSSIIVRTKGRSGTFQRIHISEFAKICKESPRKAKEIITGTIPSAPYEARVDIESTAEGEEGHFYEMFWEAWDRGEPSNPKEFKAHFYNWTWDKEEISKVKEVIPFDKMDQGEYFREYSKEHNLSDIEITFYYQTWISLNKKFDLLRQEYPTTPEEAFISSGHKLFDMDSVAKLKDSVVLGDKVGKWTYYEDYIPGHAYALGCDVAEGVGQDSSTIVVMDFTPLKPKVVATYKDNKIDADVFAYEIKNGATRYGSCLAAVERNNHGHATLSTLKQIYHNIYKEVKTDKKTDEKTEKLGWHTNGATKPRMMYAIKKAVNDGLIEVPSAEIITEMRTYDKEDLSRVRFDEEQTKHWDLLTGLAIVWQMKSENIENTQFLQTMNYNESDYSEDIYD